MPVAQPLHEGAQHLASPTPRRIGAEPLPEAEKPAAARLADDQAAPAPSPVHRLQAGLAQLTTVPEPVADEVYPGWFQVGFPLVTSLMLWAAILWGVSALA